MIFHNKRNVIEVFACKIPTISIHETLFHSQLKVLPPGITFIYKIKAPDN